MTTIPETSDEFIPLLPHQRFARDFVIQHPACALWLEMGLGKSLITLSALYDLNCPGHVLIIAPKTIARATWISEIKKWKIPIRTCSLIDNAKQRPLKKDDREALWDKVPEMPPTVFFINRELVVRLVNHYAAKRIPWPFPIVVIDEAQSFKSHRSSRFQALSKMKPYIARIIELTGTPAPNGPHDLWSQIYLLDGGFRLGKNVTTFRNRWFLPGIVADGVPLTYNPLPHAANEITHSVADIVISMKNDLLDLPPFTENDIIISLDDTERKRYQKMKKDHVLPLADGDAVIAKNAAVLQAKLSQMASGAIYTDEDGNFERIHDKKLDFVTYIIEDTPTPVLIAYYYKSDKAMIAERLEKEGIEFEVFDGTPQMINRWNAKEIPVMLLQPASAGYGLNLQEGGHTLIWYTLPWALEAYQQTNARLYRQGQTEPVIAHRLIIEHTVDEKLKNVLNKKEITQDDIMDIVRTEVTRTD